MYNDELYQLLAAIDANPRIPIKNKLIGPSVASTDWGPIDVWNTGYMEMFNDRIYAYAVERCVSFLNDEAGAARLRHSL